MKKELRLCHSFPLSFVWFPWKQTYQTWHAVCNQTEGLSFKSCIWLCFNPLYENVNDKQYNTIQPFGLRVKSHFENSDINLDDIAPTVIPENPPWLNPKPTFNFELTQHKKSETNPLLIQQHFAKIRSVTSEYSAIYADGSKNGDRVASAAVFGQ